ncbi:MAG: hypothetical protein JWS12_213 [Candidatus Saccharibacteria bacterium]|nr:hypothetical protein [Candidatus Saccharibacteria bacterium]
MNKKLHNLWAGLRHVSYWYFFAIAAVSLIVAIGALRQNNLTALHLRDQVNKVDQANGNVEGALRTLRGYIYSHMNTNLASGPNAIKPPVQLKYTYERLVEAQKQSGDAATAKIYTEAQNYCEQQFPHGLSGSGRIPCITQYITSHGGTAQQTIPEDLYKFDFVSPSWSPDLAGWSLVMFTLSLLSGLALLGLELWVKADVRKDLA